MGMVSSLGSIVFMLVIIVLGCAVATGIGVATVLGISQVKGAIQKAKREDEIDDLKHEEKVIAQRAIVQQVKKGTLIVGELLEAGKLEEAESRIKEHSRRIETMKTIERPRW